MDEMERLKELSATEKKLIGNALELWLMEMKAANQHLHDRINTVTHVEFIKMVQSSIAELHEQYADFDELIKQLRT